MDSFISNLESSDFRISEFVYPGMEKLYQFPIELKSKKWKTNSDRKVITAHKVLEELLNTCTKRGLPKYYGFETMRRLLKMNKYLYSKKHQTLELIQVLIDTNDIRLKKHIDDLCKEVNYVKII